MIINPDTCNLDTSVAGAGSTTPFTAKQTGNWMTELERAFLAEQPPQQTMQNQGDSSETIAANGNAQSNDFGSQNPFLNDSAFQSTISSNGPAAATAAAPASVESANAESFGPQSTDDTNGTEQTVQMKGPDDSSTLNKADSKTSTTQKSSQSTGRIATGKTTDSANQVELAALSPAVAVTLAAPATQGMGAVMQQVRQYQEMTINASSPIAAVSPAVDRALPNFIMSSQSSDSGETQQKSSTVLDEQPINQAAGTGPDTALTSSDEQYPVRQLHMFQNQDGVQAWIRDAGLSQPQAVAVGQAMSNELKNSGLKLNTLMVNGKKVASLFQGNQYHGQEILSFGREQIDDVSHSTLSLSQDNDQGAI
ncbi:MAG TPA: hypothetical protein VK832_05600 [Burkholderiaceae bacterium]|nr:hypothetical protein [Burkholderiaceae bacterium]